MSNSKAWLAQAQPAFCDSLQFNRLIHQENQSVAVFSTTGTKNDIATAQHPDVGSGQSRYKVELFARMKPGGHLILSRLYCRAPLQMDVNLVTTSFQFSLADALERATARERVDDISA